MSDRTEYWSQHLAAIEREGLSIKAYARREGLSPWALYQWRKRVREDARPSRAKASAGGFLSVRIDATGESAPCTLRIGAEVTLALSALPSPQWLAALSAALAEPGR